VRKVDKTIDFEVRDAGLQEKINDHINKLMEKRTEYIEMMAMAYLKLTDIHPLEVELVEERTSSLVTKWYFRRKDE
jgi:hypothetical protein